jgi:gluconolactonase
MSRPALEVRTLVEGLDHPEGVALGPDGQLWAGGEAGQLYAIGLDGSFRDVASTSGFVLGLALDRAGRLYACDMSRKEVVRFDPSDDTVSVYSSGSSDVPMRAPNYPVFDANGNLYVTDSGDWDAQDGCIFRVAPGGETTVWSREARHFPNQLCLDAFGDALLVIESTLPGVCKIPIGHDGLAGPREVVAMLPGTVPDGIAVTADAEEIFVSCYRPDRIYRIFPDGGYEIAVEDPQGVLLNQPTSLAFAGEDLDQLVIANLGGWHVSIAPAGNAGAAAAYPTLP